MSFLTVNSKGKIRPSITGSSAIAYFARRQECLRESIYHIALRNILEKRSDQHYIKNGLGGALGNRADAVNQYKNSEHKWKKELKALKNQNKMLYSIAKNFGSRRELKNINNIKAEAYKKRRYYISKSSGNELDSYLSQTSNSE